MKLAIINDSHFGVRNDSKIFLDHQRDFFQNIFFPRLEHEGIRTVLDLGDLFDRRKFISFHIFKEVKEFFFDELQSRDIEFHSIVGNHNTFYKNTNEVNSLDLLLDKYQNVHIYVHDPVELKFDSIKIGMVPWITSSNQKKCMDFIQNTDVDILMGHFDIQGFEMIRGIKSKHGLTKKMLSRFNAVYSGHYHHPSKQDNIEYLGAQYEMNWSDAGGKRGFRILDTKTRELKWIRNPVQIHHTIQYDETQFGNLDLEQFRNKYVRVIVQKKFPKFEDHMSQLQQVEPFDLKILSEYESLTYYEEDQTIETKSTLDFFKSFVDNLETELDKEKILSILESLYMEAASSTE